MNIYLAGRREDHALVDLFAVSLRTDGFKVVSTWHADDSELRMLKLANKTDAARTSYLAKLFGSALLPGSEGNEIAPTDRLAVSAGPTLLEIDTAFERFQRELKRADIVIADLEHAGLEAGFAWARRKRLIGIGNSQSPFVPYAIDTIKVAANWDHARMMLESQRLTALTQANLQRLNSCRMWG